MIPRMSPTIGAQTKLTNKTRPMMSSAIRVAVESSPTRPKRPKRPTTAKYTVIVTIGTALKQTDAIPMRECFTSVIVRSDYSLLTLVAFTFLPGNAFHNPMAIKTHPINPIPMETANAVVRS